VAFIQIAKDVDPPHVTFAVHRLQQAAGDLKSRAAVS
jgi:hypothetical protein